MSSFPGLDLYRGEVSLDLLGERDFEGGYNGGYRVGADDLYECVEAVGGGFDLPGGEVIDDPEEYVLWVPLEEGTPSMSTEEDVMSYHVARARNAEVMREEGLEVPEVGIVGSDPGGFLITPYIDHNCFDQRPEVPGGDPRRNHPHRPDPLYSEGRQNFESLIESALQEVDGESLVSAGEIVNAGSGSIDGHNKNWGLLGSDLVRLDIGEVPGKGDVWKDMPYNSPEEFYGEEGIRSDARDILEDLDTDPGKELSQEYRWLMR